MWKASLNRAIHECRFYLKPGAENHGTWNFVINKISEFRMLNQNTFFHIHEIPDEAESDSHVHLMYKGQGSLSDVILTQGLTLEQFEEAFKKKIDHGLSLANSAPQNATWLEYSSLLDIADTKETKDIVIKSIEDYVNATAVDKKTKQPFDLAEFLKNHGHEASHINPYTPSRPGLPIDIVEAGKTQSHLDDGFN